MVRSSILFALAALAFAGAAQAETVLVPATPNVTEPVPYRMDSSNQAGWWKPLDVRGDYAYMAYNGYRGDGRHTVWVARRSLVDGTWRRGCLKRRGECVTYSDDIGHKQPSLSVDGRGFIHVFAGMHHSHWQYFRSRRPGWVGRMRFRGGQLPDQSGRFTYPIVTRGSNGDVWLIARQSYTDPIRAKLYRWRVVTRRWYRIGTFAAASGYSAYPDDLVASADGSVHLLWEWAGGKAGAVRHAASYMTYTPSTGAYANAAGEAVPVPATPDSPVVYQPLEEGELWTHVMDGYGQRGAKLSVENGMPIIAYRYQAPADGSQARLAAEAKIRLAGWDGSTWQRQVVYENASSTALGISQHDGQTRVYFDDGPVASGTIAVEQVGGSDYLYRSDPSRQTLYFGRS